MNGPGTPRDVNEEPRRYGLLLALTAAAYPAAIVALHGTGGMLRAAGGWGGRLDGAVAFALALGLVLSVPTLGVAAAHRLGRVETPSAVVTRTRRLAHLVAASPPLFTFLGVLLFLGQVARADDLAWVVLWGAIGVWLSRRDEARLERSAPAVAPRVRTLHGVTALFLLLFILPHVANHLAGAWSAEAHVAVMKTLRLFYRSHLLEPVLILLVGLQVATGLALWWRRSALPSTSIFDTVQTCAGLYLAVFLSSHVTAVLVLGRAVLGVDTDFYFASGGPQGLLAEPWNARLVPHYALAPLSLFSHLACALRLKIAERSPARADAVARSLIVLGGVVGAVVVAALCGMHLSAGLP
jgi:hypothetical protein